MSKPNDFLDDEPKTTPEDSSGSEDISTQQADINPSSTYLNHLLYKNEAAANQQAINTLTDQYKTARANLIAQNNLNQIAQNESLAAQGLAKSYNQNPSSGYGESSRIALDVALQNNLASLGQEERETINTLTQAMARSQQYANTYLAQYNMENNLNSLNNKLANAYTREALTPEEINAYKQATGTDIYSYLYNNEQYDILAKTVLNNANYGNLSDEQLYNSLTSLTYDDMIANADSISKLLGDKSGFDAIKSLVSNEYNDNEKNYIYNLMKLNPTDINDAYKFHASLSQGHAMGKDANFQTNVLKGLGITKNEYETIKENANYFMSQKIANNNATNEEKSLYKSIGYRWYPESTSATMVDNGKSISDVTNWRKERDMAIKIDGKTYKVEYAGGSIDLTSEEKNDTNLKTNMLVIKNGELYVNDGSCWRKLKAQSDKEDQFENLYNIVKGTGAEYNN